MAWLKGFTDRRLVVMVEKVGALARSMEFPSLLGVENLKEFELLLDSRPLHMRAVDDFQT